MPSKIRLKDLAIGMFVEVYSGNPKTPWFGEIFQILAKKKSVLAKTSAKRGGGGGGKGGDEASEPIAVKWIARVNGAKGKAYEYKGGSNMIWLESIIKCGFDLDCGVYLQKKGGKKTPAAAKTTALAVRKSTPTKTTALAVRKSTPTKTESTKVQRQILAAKAQLAKAHERKRREKAKLTKTVRELKRKLATAEKALAKLDSGHGIAKRKKTQTATGTKTLKPKLVSTKSPGKKALNGKKNRAGCGKGRAKSRASPLQSSFTLSVISGPPIRIRRMRCKNTFLLIVVTTSYHHLFVNNDVNFSGWPPPRVYYTSFPHIGVLQTSSKNSG